MRVDKAATDPDQQVQLLGRGADQQYVAGDHATADADETAIGEHALHTFVKITTQTIIERHMLHANGMGNQSDTVEPRCRASLEPERRTDLRQSPRSYLLTHRGNASAGHCRADVAHRESSRHWQNA